MGYHSKVVIEHFVATLPNDCANSSLSIDQFVTFISQRAAQLLRILLSLSHLNPWLPRGQADPDVMQGTADFHHRITDALLPQAALTTRQRLTRLLTGSIRSRREWSPWLALCCPSGRSAPGVSWSA